MSRKYIEVRKVKWWTVIGVSILVFFALVVPLIYNYGVELEQSLSIRCMYYTAMECPKNDLIDFTSFYLGGISWVVIGFFVMVLVLVEELTKTKKYYIKGGK